MKRFHVHTVVVCASVVAAAACGQSASNTDLVPPACGIVVVPRTPGRPGDRAPPEQLQGDAASRMRRSR